MKKDIIDYYPNGEIRRKISFYDNGNKFFEQYFGLGLPTYQQWYDNGMIRIKTYYIHGKRYNINNPSYLCFFNNGRIMFKSYWLNNYNYSKLNWMNFIKNI